MRSIFIILRKEFRQIFRNKINIPIIFVMPFLQLLILVNAASFEIRHLKLHVMDFDQTPASRRLISRFSGSPYFDIVNYSHADNIANEDFIHDNAGMVLRIPQHFEKDMMTQGVGKLQVVINAIDGSAAAVSYAYAQSIIADFNKQIVVDWIGKKQFEPPVTIISTVSFWFNPDMNYYTFMVPGILVMLVTMIGMFLAAMNIVREKEIGTIEQLNVTPIRKHQFIIGKLLPFWIIGLFELAFGLFLGKLIFDIPIVGSIWLIFFFASIYLLLILGIGLLFSTLASTQQQAMFLSYFFMVIFILMSGLFTPIESMPEWAQLLTKFNPIAYFVSVMRLVMLKGAGIMDIHMQILAVFTGAIAILGLATWRYRKVAA
ncbi:MAG: ABC transporter permease [Chitinophagales bacterium]|nr:MAG: ABC transporter permease [Chitinophagales bacterium]